MRTGFIGLGAMGWHMAGHLADKGLLAAVWSHTADKARSRAAELTVPAVPEPDALWQHADAVVLCVRADAEMLATVDALATGAARGKLVIDASTVAPAAAEAAARRLATVGARFIDAPITGGTEGARLGRLTFMVGGEAADLAAAQPILQAMGARIEHLGPVGAGQACKAVNQVMAAGINQAVCEGLRLAEASGLDIGQVVDVVGSGAAGSWFVQHRGRSMVAGDYPPGFRMALHLKDLRICSDIAARHGLRLPLVERTIDDYETLIATGHGDDDISALYRAGGASQPEVAASLSPPEEYWFAEEGVWITEWWNCSGDAQLSVARARVPAGGSTRPHRLAGTVERYVVLSGSGTAQVEDAELTLAPGAVICIPPGGRQSVRAATDADLVFLAICTPRFRPACYHAAGEA